MRVLGIDPGSTATGYGVVEGRGTDVRLIECGVIRSPRQGDLAVRLLHIYSDIQAVIERLQPDCMAVEGVFYRENPRTAVVLAHARGVALLAGAECGIPVAEYPPAEIKKAVEKMFDVVEGPTMKPYGSALSNSPIVCLTCSATSSQARAAANAPWLLALLPLRCHEDAAWIAESTT